MSKEIYKLADKVRKALKNGSGINLTPTQLYYLATLAVFNPLYEAEKKEMLGWQEISNDNINLGSAGSTQEEQRQETNIGSSAGTKEAPPAPYQPGFKLISTTGVS